MWLAAKYPETVQVVVAAQQLGEERPIPTTQSSKSWQLLAKAVGRAGDDHSRDLPLRFTPELYATRPDYVDSLAGFVRSRPAQSVTDFIQQSERCHRS